MTTTQMFGNHDEYIYNLFWGYELLSSAPLDQKSLTSSNARPALSMQFILFCFAGQWMESVTTDIDPPILHF
jgi:hypothetical protein